MVFGWRHPLGSHLGRMRLAVNLRTFGGRVPIAGTDPNQPITLVDFPSRELFNTLYTDIAPGYTADHTVKKYWEILNARKDGATLAEAGKLYGLTRERVRQIEARFRTLLSLWHSQQETS
jgi:hypothetical protein